MALERSLQKGFPPARTVSSWASQCRAASFPEKVRSPAAWWRASFDSSAGRAEDCRSDTCGHP